MIGLNPFGNFPARDFRFKPGQTVRILTIHDFPAFNSQIRNHETPQISSAFLEVVACMSTSIYMLLGLMSRGKYHNVAVSSGGIAGGMPWRRMNIGLAG